MADESAAAHRCTDVHTMRWVHKIQNRHDAPRTSIYDEDGEKGVKHAINGKKNYMTPSHWSPLF